MTYCTQQNVILQLIFPRTTLREIKYATDHQLFHYSFSPIYAKK